MSNKSFIVLCLVGGVLYNAINENLFLMTCGIVAIFLVLAYVRNESN